MSKLLEEQSKKYAARKRVAERAAVRWQWATGPYYELDPYFAERCGRTRGRLLPSAPARKRGGYEFGFDSDDRLRVIRQYAGNPKHAYETFVEWSARRAVAVRYDYDPKHKDAMTVDVLTLRGGRPVTNTHRSAHATVKTVYGYSGDRLVRIRSKIRGEADRVFSLSHDAQGLRSIYEGRRKVFERTSPAQSLDELLPKIERRLLEQTPRAIRKAAAHEKSRPWCCALVFDSSDTHSGCLPPELALSTDRGAGWFAPGFDGFGVPYYDDRLLAAECKLANEHFRWRKTTAPAPALVVRLAKRLNALPRRSFGKVAEEFVVYAYDRDRPESALVVASTTARQRERLARIGLVP